MVDPYGRVKGKRIAGKAAVIRGSMINKCMVEGFKNKGAAHRSPFISGAHLMEKINTEKI
jgi:hypothetical protein